MNPALELAARLARRELSAVDAVTAALAQIRAHDELGAFASLDEAGALRQARRADALRARGVELPFLGVPVGIKDCDPVRGFVTGFGSRAFRWLYAPVDGQVARAMRRAGFVILGKTSTSELTILPIVGHATGRPARSPLAPDHFGGGSSGGSAVAVAAHLFPVGPGSDGAGSIRIPAAFCGLVGMKPGRGVLPSPFGAFDPSGITSLGALAHSVRDAAALLDVLGGHGFGAAVERTPPPRLRVRLLVSSTIARVEPEIAARTIEVAKRLEAMGNSLAPAPPFIASIDEFLPIMARMAARVPMGPLMTRALEPTTRFLRAWGRELDDRQVAERATALGDRVLAWFGDTDILVTPTVAIGPPRIDAYAGLDGEALMRACAPLGAFTAPFNLSGQPAISIPAGTTRAGLPIGVQLVGRARADRLLLQLAARLG